MSEAQADEVVTTGPWYPAAQNDALYVTAGRPPALNNDYPDHGADRVLIAKVYTGPADSNLIAAAPELLEALELLVALPVRYHDNRIEIDTGSHGEAMEIVRKARAAIAKAEGR